MKYETVYKVVAVYPDGKLRSAVIPGNYKLCITYEPNKEIVSLAGIFAFSSYKDALNFCFGFSADFASNNLQIWKCKAVLRKNKPNATNYLNLRDIKSVFELIKRRKNWGLCTRKETVFCRRIILEKLIKEIRL